MWVIFSSLGQGAEILDFFPNNKWIIIIVRGEGVTLMFRGWGGGILPPVSKRDLSSGPARRWCKHGGWAHYSWYIKIEFWASRRGSYKMRSAPVVTGISPAEGPPGTRVTIRGENFGTHAKDVIGTSLFIHAPSYTWHLVTTVRKWCRKDSFFVQRNELLLKVPDHVRITTLLTFHCENFVKIQSSYNEETSK